MNRFRIASLFALVLATAAAPAANAGDTNDSATARSTTISGNSYVPSADSMRSGFID